MVLPDAVYPLAPRGERTGDEIPALSLPGAETPHDLEKGWRGGRDEMVWWGCGGSVADLALRVHEGDCVAAIADDELVARFGEGVYGVDGDVSLAAGDGGLEGVDAFRALQIPHL